MGSRHEECMDGGGRIGNEVVMAELGPVLVKPANGRHMCQFVVVEGGFLLLDVAIAPGCFWLAGGIETEKLGQNKCGRKFGTKRTNCMLWVEIKAE